MPTFRANWNYPTSIRFGAGRISELGEVLAELKATAPLFVTDPGLIDSEMVQHVLSDLRSKNIRVGTFSNFKGNPIDQNVTDGVATFHKGNHDSVIAFGGGSALDVGKAIAFMTRQTMPLMDFEDIGDNWKRANTEGLPPVIAVPTTAGTGSEVGRASVITHQATHKKAIIFHPRFLPNVVISDPELTLGLPPKLTAATGMDALAHALEAYVAPGFHPMADGIAVEAIRLIKNNLALAVLDGSNIEARANMLAAASMGAAAFQKGLGAIHSLSHPLGALYDLHHGLLNAVVMPYVFTYNRKAIEERMTRLAAYLDLPNPGFDSIMEWILDLRKEIGIPNTLAELGVRTDRLEELSIMAEADPSTSGNPMKIDRTDMKKMFEMAIAGGLNHL
jgi:alcohol dehydrogenase class IV